MYGTENRLFMYFPGKFMKNTPYLKGEPVRIILKKNNLSSVLITKFNYIITIKKEIVNELRLKKDSKVVLKIEKLREVQKPKSLFYKNKIDLLFFLPEVTCKESEIYSEEITVNGVHFIRAVSIHSRGSSKQTLLKRFIDPNMFGRLLGQIQAEGSKTKYDTVEFCNKNLLELRDFVYFLSELGIPENKLVSKLDYNVCFEDILQKIIGEFEGFLGLKVSYLSSSTRKAKGYGFKIILKNTILAELLLNSLKLMRKNMENIKWDENLTAFSEGYLSKLLCGDGTFEITSKSRKKVQSRIKIYDGNKEYLHHYSKILKKFGFFPYVKEKQLFVRAMCNLKLAKKLLEIGAFETNDNRKRVNLFIENNEAISNMGEDLN